MKNCTLALIAIMLWNYSTHAQTDRWTIKPGENVNSALALDVKFHYPGFTEGTVFFRDGTRSNAQLDYNLLTEEMQFIAPKGDTLAVANESTIKYITIGNDTFFYDKVYMQLITSNTTAKLAKREALAIADVKKAGAYDQYSSTSSITTVKSVRLQDRVTNFTESQELTIVKETTYYVGDTYNHFLPANKKNIIKLFGKKQNAIEQYLKDNKVTFNKEEDLKALITFLEG
jgi:hypothetical protein